MRADGHQLSESTVQRAMRRRGLLRPPDQLAEFLDVVATDDLYALWLLIAYHGVRRGEAAGLPDFDVDLENATIDIREILADIATTLDVSEDSLEDPKSEAGARTISVDASILKALDDYRSRREERRRALGAAWINSGRFFTQPNGAPLDSAWLSHRFRQLVEQAGTLRTHCLGTTKHKRPCGRRVPIADRYCHQHDGSRTVPIRDGLPPVRLHDLRHGSATYAVAAGIASKVM
jgi:integrase